MKALKTLHFARNVTNAGARGTGDISAGKPGVLRDFAGMRSRRTRRSYHAACPVTGSEFDNPVGRVSGMRWFSRKPRVASGASGASDQAPGRLPMAFHVQTVSGFSASIRATGTSISA